MSSTNRDDLDGTAGCARFQQLALDRRYDGLSSADDLLLGRHLAGCASCSAAESEWSQISALLAAPEVKSALTGLGSVRNSSTSSAMLPALLGGLTASVSLLPVLLQSSHSRIGSTMLGLTALLWTLVYQALFAGLLAEHRRQRLPLPIDIRTVLLGLFACEGILVLGAAALLGVPLLEWRLAAAVRLSLPELLTSLSGSILLAVGAFIGFRGEARPVTNAIGIAILHSLLLLPGEMLIDRYPGSPAEVLATLAFLAVCAAVGAALGAMGAASERVRASLPGWHAEPA